MAIILWDGISNFEDKILLINVFESRLCKNSRPQKFTDHTFWRAKDQAMCNFNRQ